MEAYKAGKAREPMDDHDFVSYIQPKGNERHAPYSPGAVMNEAQRKILDENLNCWKQGWDDAHSEDLEK